MAGFIMIPRDIEETWVWDDPKRLRRWLKILMQASYEDCTRRLGNKKYEVKKGQIVCRFSELMSWLKISNRALHIFLDNLVDEGLIQYSVEIEKTTITVLSLTQNVIEKSSISSTSGNSSHRKAKIVKEVEEIEEENKLKNSSQFSRERNFEFLNLLLDDEKYLIQVSQFTGYDVPELKKLAKNFTEFFALKEKIYPNKKEFYDHFLNWLNQKLEREKGAALNTSINYGSQSKYAARRSTPVDPNAEDGRDDADF